MDANAEHAAIARAIIDGNMYMTLGTADETGRPWASPVYYAPSGYHEFFWVSSIEAAHSKNIAVRPEVSIVIFDSHAPIGTGQGVYMAAVVGQVPDDELARGIEIFSRSSVAHGADPWTGQDVEPPGIIRLYRATVIDHSILDPERRGQGRGDYRVRVSVA